MRIDDTADQHDDLDTDSLFGSPPPSPGRGRSPSPVPLALPSGQDQDMSQNVGTLALPGSHLCSELPPALPPAPPLAALPRPRPVTQVRRSSQDKSTTHAAKSRPATASSRLVAGVRPADLALQRQTRGQSASNPIVVEDESEQPMIGRRPLANRFPTQVTSVKPPSYEEIIQALVKQKNLVPVLHALLRVVTGSAQLSQYPPPLTGATTPAQGSTSQNYPYYPQSFTYPYGYYYPPLPSPGPSVSPHPPTNAGISRPPKRRRLSSVPAGASDWDVPYPFAEGQGPPNYRTNWEKERGKQLIEDLINLVKSAARKAAAKKVVDGVKKDETEQEERGS
ncbi:hypothetical protein NM688_g8644 [Phlebia brevispora]|uniref:Uncharacterized protein n=1 Tax=Phlebia brevispora TaxID=194682 RepID=A0ACC1RSW5_9APHY|nr:hypothetical protein NM688_g8644 [Phlebia brevispora]